MLITGDTGAGKEPIATAIHTNPPRSERKAQLAGQGARV
jgi:transcriptional regulator with GAF, ATPase, and Fis domain